MTSVWLAELGHTVTAVTWTASGDYGVAAAPAVVDRPGARC
ncbi:MAG: hypothetical protein QN183_15020 [Armatimonadota bacterium]|nr:hypothetical protein [Armatimonadota bacterium]